jgi:hypothetical protein
MLLSRLMNASIAVQRAVAIAALIVLITLLGGVTWIAVGTIESKQLALLELRERAGRLTKLSAMKSGLQPSSATDAVPAGQELFLEAESLTIGRANLQSSIEAIAQSNNTVLASAGSVPDSDEEGIKLIGLRIDVSGSYEAVQKAIVGIETSKPPLLVRDLSVRLVSGERGDRPVELAAQLKIFGAFRLTGNDQTAPTNEVATP